MASEAKLSELNAKSAQIGRWTVRVHGCRLIEYEYAWQGKPKQGCKVECLLMSSDSTEYCRGVIKAVKGDKAELKRQQDKFGNGTVWTIAKVAMAKRKQ